MLQKSVELLTNIEINVPTLVHRLGDVYEWQTTW